MLFFPLFYFFLFNPLSDTFTAGDGNLVALMGYFKAKQLSPALDMSPAISSRQCSGSSSPCVTEELELISVRKGSQSALLSLLHVRLLRSVSVCSLVELVPKSPWDPRR